MTTNVGMGHLVVLESQRKHSLTNTGNENYVKRLTFFYLNN